MTTSSGDGLRAPSISALGVHGDPRARDALVHGDVTIEEGVAGWEGSAGRVRAHKVTLAVDAARLGGLRAAPAAVDALAAALARAVAEQPGEVLHGLELRWSKSAPLLEAGEQHGYRGGPPPEPETPGEALVAYLEGAGEPALAESVRGGVVTLTEVGGVVLPSGAQRASRSTVSRLVAAAADLFGVAASRVSIAK